MVGPTILAFALAMSDGHCVYQARRAQQIQDALEAAASGSGASVSWQIVDKPDSGMGLAVCGAYGHELLVVPSSDDAALLGRVQVGLQKLGFFGRNIELMTEAGYARLVGDSARLDRLAFKGETGKGFEPMNIADPSIDPKLLVGKDWLCAMPVGTWQFRLGEHGRLDTDDGKTGLGGHYALRGKRIDMYLPDSYGGPETNASSFELASVAPGVITGTLRGESVTCVSSR